ncbi:hypothetical protein M405DRAFT_834616, partial [Rhizopogon salebrosus TDB-379]
MYDSSMSMLSRLGGDSRMRNLNALESRYICPTSGMGAMEWSSEESVSPCLGLPSFICLLMLRI